MKRVSYVLLLVALISVAQAELVDDFDSYDISSSTNVRDVASPPWTAIGGTGQADIFDDGTGNQVLGFGWNSGWRGTYNDNITAIAEGTAGAVLFFNVYANGESLNHSWGLCDVEGSSIDWFDDMEVQIGMTDSGTSGDGLVRLHVRDGGGNISVDIAAETWYNVWAVINQVNDTYDVYISTGTADFATAMLIADDASFRNASAGAVGDLTALLGCGYNAGSQEDMWIDNVDITIPEPATLFLLSLGTFSLRRRK